MRIRRLPVQDSLTVGGETVVLVRGQAVALSGPASRGLAQLTDEWMPVDAWFRAVVEVVGAPEDPAVACAGLVAGLVDIGCAEVEQ